MNFDTQIEKMKDDMIEATRRLIQIRSIQGEPEGEMPYGKGMDDAINYLLSLAAGMGFKTKKIDGYCGYAEYGEGDIYIGIFGHVDVNEENEGDWKYDPYGAVVEKERIYGSCAVDKGALIAAIFALKAVKEVAGKLNRKVRLIIGTDERRYYKDMASYLNSENAPIAGFSVDGHFPVTYAEKALAMIEYRMDVKQDEQEYIEYIQGGKIDNLVPGYCCAKIVTTRKNEILDKLMEYTAENRKDINAKILKDGLFIEVFGKERHCALIERGINSNAIMLDFLKSVDLGNGSMKKAIDFLCDKIGFDIYGESMDIAYEDEFSGKTVVNFGIMDLHNDKMKIRLDCRFPTTSNYYQAIEKVNSEFVKAGFDIKECSYWPPTYFPRNHFLINALIESYKTVTGDGSEPISSSSASYSKVMPNIAAFGAHYPGEGIIWDQTDEYLEIESLETTAKIYANAIYKLCMEV